MQTRENGQPSSAACILMSLSFTQARRPLGLAGVWGAIIRASLHELLPDDAAQMCSGRMEVVMTAGQGAQHDGGWRATWASPIWEVDCRPLLPCSCLARKFWPIHPI